MNHHVIFILYLWNSADVSGNAIKSIFTYLFMWTQFLNAYICKNNK